MTYVPVKQATMVKATPRRVRARPRPRPRRDLAALEQRRMQAADLMALKVCPAEIARHVDVSSQNATAAASIVAVMLGASTRRIAAEEAMLVDHLGAAYRDYMHQTSRLLLAIY